MKIEDEIKGKFRNEYHKGLINLTYTAKQLSYEFYQSLKKHGLAEQQYNVLRILRGLTKLLGRKPTDVQTFLKNLFSK